MAVCEVCGKEYDGAGESVRIYTARLLSREVSKSGLPGKSVASRYSNFKPVSLTICKRHRRELYVQRIMPGVFAFLISFVLIFIILISVRYFLRAPTIWNWYIFGASILISLFVVWRSIRLITLEGLVATAKTVNDRREGAEIEYLTPRKYQRITQEPANRGILGLAATLRAKYFPGQGAATASKEKAAGKHTPSKKNLATARRRRS